MKRYEQDFEPECIHHKGHVSTTTFHIDTDFVSDFVSN